jgi:hypothetical protein
VSMWLGQRRGAAQFQLKKVKSRGLILKGDKKRVSNDQTVEYEYYQLCQFYIIARLLRWVNGREGGEGLYFSMSYD